MRTRPSSKLVCIHKTDAQAGILFLPLLLWKELNPQSFSRLWVVQTTLDIFTSLPIPLPALEYSVPSPHCPPPPTHPSQSLYPAHPGLCPRFSGERWGLHSTSWAPGILLEHRSHHVFFAFEIHKVQTLSTAREGPCSSLSTHNLMFTDPAIVNCPSPRPKT